MPRVLPRPIILCEDAVPLIGRGGWRTFWLVMMLDQNSVPFLRTFSLPCRIDI